MAPRTLPPNAQIRLYDGGLIYMHNRRLYDLNYAGNAPEEVQEFTWSSDSLSIPRTLAVSDHGETILVVSIKDL